MDTQAIVARRIRVARVERGLKQAQLAELIGTDQRYVSRIESGAVNIGVQTVALIAQMLNKPVGFFFEPVDGAQELPKGKSPAAGAKRKKAA